MSGTVNKVILLGNLGKDPEIRRGNSGDRVANLTVATSEQWRDKTTGERKERTEWHRVVIFNDGLAAIAEQYLRKGSTVYLEGQLATRKWTDQSGQDRYTTEVVLQKFGGTLTLVGGRRDGSAGSAPTADGPEAYGQTRSRPADAKGRSISENPENRGAAYDLDDEIPF